MAVARFTQEERDHALRALNAFAAEPRWRTVRFQATATYFHGLMEDATAKERRIAERHGNVCACHEAYCLADFQAEGFASLAAAFRASKRALLLTRGARAWLDEFAASTTSAYEVLATVPGSHLRLRDLLTGRECEVFDRLGSRDCRPGAMIAARVMARGDGRLGFHGDTLYLPGSAEEMEEILQQVFLCMEKLSWDEDGHLVFGKTLAPLFFAHWFAGNFRDVAATVPVRINGELAEPGFATYQMPPGASAARAFAGIEGMFPEDDDCWNYRPVRNGKHRMFGRFLAQGVWLRIESFGRDSMKQMRAVAQAAFGGLLRHHSTRYEPPLRARSGEKSDLEVDRIPLDVGAIGVPPEHPEFQERARAAHLAKHYGTWARHPLPALNGRTPADAAADPALRARVLELIEDMERLEREDLPHRGPGARVFDFGPLRRELGFGAREAEKS